MANPFRLRVLPQRLGRHPRQLAVPKLRQLPTPRTGVLARRTFRKKAVQQQRLATVRHANVDTAPPEAGSRVFRLFHICIEDFLAISPEGEVGPTCLIDDLQLCPDLQLAVGAMGMLGHLGHWQRCIDGELTAVKHMKHWHTGCATVRNC